MARAKLNNNKSNYTDVMDPFAIQSDWFVLELPSCRIKPGDRLPDHIIFHVTETISRLKLNEFEFYDERQSLLQDYCAGKFPLAHLEKNYPFIAYELKRQRMETTIKTILNKRPPIV